MVHHLCRIRRGVVGACCNIAETSGKNMPLKRTPVHGVEAVRRLCGSGNGAYLLYAIAGFVVLEIGDGCGTALDLIYKTKGAL
jgi:hypothetical protein